MILGGIGGRILRMAGLPAAMLLGAAAWGEEPLFRPSREARTISTDLYEISIQKNGRTDVRFAGGEEVFSNASPQVQIAGESAVRPLPVDAAFTARAPVNDPLGQGQGMVFGKKQCQWFIRTYPAQPFFTVQVVYTNTAKKPVKIARLIPWSAAGVALGANASETRILENGRLFTIFDDFAEVVQHGSRSQWNLAAHNPASGQSLIAGFLTSLRAYTQVELARSGKAADTAFDTFRAECVYDPPVEVAPGASLESEILYIAVAEREPLAGLDRYGKAVAAWNGVRRGVNFLPHGWDSWSTRYHTGIDEGILLRELDALDRNLKRYGWNHFAIDSGWERMRGDWREDPAKFPNGMKAIADEVHRRGMTAGLWIAPFTVDARAPIASDHPEWMQHPDARGKLLMGNDTLILDVTAPGAADYVRELCRTITHDWGYDALMEADFVYHLLLAEGYAQPNLTRIEIFRMGMLAIREGIGPNRFLMSMTPQMVNGVISDGIRTGMDCAPVWRAASRRDPWGAVDTLTNSIRRFYLSPHVFVPDQDCAFLGHESSRERWRVMERPPLTPEQRLAWLTGAALTGGVLKIGEPFSDLSEGEVNILRRLLPAAGQPARPIDLFQMDSPRVWALPLRTPAGSWTILGLFNWNEQRAETIHAPLEALALDAGGYHTVFDFWNSHYHGTVRGEIAMEVPPGSVRLLGLRPFNGQPMLLATDAHITQGALDHESITWDAGARRLSGRFVAIPQTDYLLTLLAPPPHVFQSAVVSCGEPETLAEGGVVRLRFRNGDSAQVTWTAQF